MAKRVYYRERTDSILQSCGGLKSCPHVTHKAIYIEDRSLNT